MAKFEDAIAIVLDNEGGYVCDPDDPGGETKYGICKRTYPNLDIKNLTQKEAADIYRRDFWNALYDQIEAQPIATKIFDMAVNMGSHQAHKLVQRAISDNFTAIVVDGIFGHQTVSAINAFEPDKVLQSIRDEAKRFYTELAEKRPGSHKFLAGWLKRAAQ